MTYFYTCRGCAFEKGDCQAREAIRSALSGLGVGSLKHKCRDRQPLFKPGSAVFVYTASWLSRDEPDYDEPGMRWYPGVFVRQLGPSAIAFVKPGAFPENDEDDLPFETRGRGFVKVPLARIMASSADPVSLNECECCGDILALTGCGRNRPPTLCPASSLRGDFPPSNDGGAAG